MLYPSLILRLLVIQQESALPPVKRALNLMSCFLCSRMISLHTLNHPRLCSQLQHHRGEHRVAGLPLCLIFPWNMRTQGRIQRGIPPPHWTFGHILPRGGRLQCLLVSIWKERICRRRHRRNSRRAEATADAPRLHKECRISAVFIVLIAFWIQCIPESAFFRAIPTPTAAPKAAVPTTKGCSKSGKLRSGGCSWAISKLRMHHISQMSTRNWHYVMWLHAVAQECLLRTLWSGHSTQLFQRSAGALSNFLAAKCSRLNLSFWISLSLIYVNMLNMNRYLLFSKLALAYFGC